MKSFRQYISEAGIRKKMRKQEALRKKVYKSEMAAREQKPGAPSDEQIDATWEELDATANAIDREQIKRRPRIFNRALDLAGGETAAERLKSAADIASELEDVEVPSPMRSRLRKMKERKAKRK